VSKDAAKSEGGECWGCKRETFPNSGRETRFLNKRGHGVPKNVKEAPDGASGGENKRGSGAGNWLVVKLEGDQNRLQIRIEKTVGYKEAIGREAQGVGAIRKEKSRWGKKKSGKSKAKKGSFSTKSQKGTRRNLNMSGALRKGTRKLTSFTLVKRKRGLTRGLGARHFPRKIQGVHRRGKGPSDPDERRETRGRGSAETEKRPARVKPASSFRPLEGNEVGLTFGLLSRGERFLATEKTQRKKAKFVDMAEGETSYWKNGRGHFLEASGYREAYGSIIETTGLASTSSLVKDLRQGGEHESSKKSARMFEGKGGGDKKTETETRHGERSHKSKKMKRKASLPKGEGESFHQAVKKN